MPSQEILKAHWHGALRKNGWPIGIAALVFAGLTFFAHLSPALAVLSFAVLTAALLIGHVRTADRASAPASSQIPLQRAPDLQAVLDALPDAAVAIDARETVIGFNAAAHALAPALRSGGALSAGWRAPALLSAVRAASAGGMPQRVDLSEQVPIERWFDVHIAPLRLASDEHTSPRSLILVFHDLTPLHRSEQMRADFVANASHELRTPLATLSGFIETLQGSARDDAAARERFLGIMHVQARRMTRLIDDLLSLSRIELTEHVRPRDSVELVGVIRQVVDALQPLATDRGVGLRAALPDAPVLVRGDRDELLRVFENLVENALKYGASGKRVDIALLAEDTNHAVRVDVRDYGPGIAPEHLPRLTERFYRVNVSQSRSEGGTGLGLALVKHILNRHGGRLSIISVPTAGATFTAHLPRNGESA
jgi:two-component system, OmpR family, phosphate regulon sensor histidine kinase PhoR